MTREELQKMRRIAGFVLLGSAALVWLTAIMMSPHGETPSTGVDHVKASVALYTRNASLGVLLLVLIAAAALFWGRRPTRSAWDVAALVAIALLGLSSFYQLAWIETDVLDSGPVQSSAAERT